MKILLTSVFLLRREKDILKNKNYSTGPDFCIYVPEESEDRSIVFFPFLFQKSGSGMSIPGLVHTCYSKHELYPFLVNVHKTCFLLDSSLSEILIA